MSQLLVRDLNEERKPS